MAIDFSKIVLTNKPLVIPGPDLSPTAGAVLDFLGVVREKESTNLIAGLDYEAYDEMALSKLKTISCETLEKYRLESICLIHRVGFVAAGEVSLFLRVSAGHRDEAFLASREIIERLKQEVPIWKNPVITQSL